MAPFRTLQTFFRALKSTRQRSRAGVEVPQLNLHTHDPASTSDAANSDTVSSSNLGRHTFLFASCLHKQEGSLNLPNSHIKVDVSNTPYSITHPAYCCICSFQDARRDYTARVAFYNKHPYTKLDASDERLLLLKHRRNQDVLIPWLEFLSVWDGVENQDEELDWVVINCRLLKDDEGLVTRMIVLAKVIAFSDDFFEVDIIGLGG